MKKEGAFNVVLVEPEIPQNTGNIARTCAVTGSRLHLVEPFGFSLDEKHLKRAGLDYWDKLDIITYRDLDDFYKKNPDGPYFYFSTKAARRFTEIEYPLGSYLVFGKETKGLPEPIVFGNPESAVRIPMKKTLRSLNLGNSVAIALYEALRQNGFQGLV